ncbi:MAG: hypothetical protein EOO29_16990 [Comamonadaceae bacterium]|nr:MAG: hypothetical protein EOO29_16990 [Comamonadaceae bacterium]
MPSPRTAEFLARFGLSFEQARDIVIAHLDSPAILYAAADEYGLKFDIIGELVGVDVSVVNSYFVGANLSPAITLLAQYGLTLGDLRPAVNSLADAAPAALYHEAVANGLRLDILAEISGNRSASDFQTLFTANGLDAAALGGSSGGGGGVPLFSGDLPDFFQSLVGFNDQAGSLSTDVIRAKVLGSGVSQADYNATFDVSQYSGAADGTFDPTDLGFSHLGSFAATGANLESLYYGTLIRTFHAIDEQELTQILQFTESNEAALEAGDPATLNAYLQLMQGVFEDPGMPPMFTPDMLSDTLAFTTVAFIQQGSTGELGPLFGTGAWDIFG